MLLKKVVTTTLDGGGRMCDTEISSNHAWFKISKD